MMLFVRGGLGANLKEVVSDLLVAGDPIEMCLRRVDEDPQRVLETDTVLKHKSVCFTTPELLADAGFTLEHTQEFGEPTHWTARLADVVQGTETHEQRVSRLAATMASCLRGPVEKGAARARVADQDLRGLQPPR